MAKKKHEQTTQPAQPAQPAPPAPAVQVAPPAPASDPFLACNIHPDTVAALKERVEAISSGQTIAEILAEDAPAHPPDPDLPVAVKLLHGFVVNTTISTTARIDAAEALLAPFAGSTNQVHYVYCAPAFKFLWEIAEHKVNADVRERVRALALLAKHGGL